MIRFRFTEDEERYLQLRSEVYRLLAQNLPPQLVSKAMRNFGKLEQLVHFEGVRQGFAGAELSLMAMPQARGLKAFQAHAFIYGSTDTPLVQVEDEHIAAAQQQNVASSAWLDRQPMRYAPQTLAEWEGETEAPVASDDDPASLFKKIIRLKEENPELIPYVEGEKPFYPKQFFQTAEDKSVTGAEMSTVVPFEPDATEEPQEGAPANSPQFLDRVRDQLQNTGEKFESWQDLIFGLHVGMGVDAGYLDIILSTPEGLTVLAQCNQTHLHPGAAMNLQELKERS